MAFYQTIGLMNDFGELFNLANMLDKTTGGIKSLTNTEHWINKGIFFESFVKFNVASGATYKMAITTPANKTIHWIPSRIVTTGPKITVAFYIDGGFTGGTLVTPYNHNMNSSIVPTLVLKSNVTYTPSTDPFTQVFLGGGTGVGQSRSGSETTVASKWILAPSTDYVFVFTNGGESEETIQINNSWAEEG